MISVHTVKRRDDAIAAVKKLKTDTPVYSCVTIFADVLLNNEKIGHLASDGYTHTTWSFYPVDKNRMQCRDKAFEDVLPKWTGDVDLGAFENTVERREKREAEEKNRERQEILSHQVYTAIDAESFPCNPIPFANSLADHVRVFGTDSIKTDDAKKILWILMGQAYGQMATIDLNDEWDRLTKRGGTST